MAVAVLVRDDSVGSAEVGSGRGDTRHGESDGAFEVLTGARRDTDEAVAAIAQEVGTRTYTRFDYAFQVVTTDEVRNPRIYHCYHMCRDLVHELDEAGVRAWSVMGYAEIDGYKQLHPVVVVEVDGKYGLLDPAFGILRPVTLFEGDQATPDGKYRVSCQDCAISLDNTSNGKRFHYSFAPTQPSFRTPDNLLVRRNNFGGDQYTMTYRYDTAGQIIANVMVYHQDKEAPTCGYVAIMLRDGDSGKLATRKFSMRDACDNCEEYARMLRQACVCLGSDTEEIGSQIAVLLENIGRLRDLQQRARIAEMARQCSGASLW